MSQLIKDDVYVSCDPGASGSWCALLAKHNKVIFKNTTDDPLLLLEWLNQLKTEYNLRLIMIEDVHSILGMSAKSNFSFGWNVGEVNLIAKMSKVMVDKVTPKKWQKFIGVKEKGPAIKKEVAGIAIRLYPTAELFGPRGGLLDGRSDALMIAHYAAYNRT